MVQVKFYGRRSVWAQRRDELSDVVQHALADAFELPLDKRFHRFCWLDDDDLVAPRSDDYLILEIVCFAGRSPDAKRRLIRELYTSTGSRLGLDPDDLEVVVLESPRENWGIRGRVADELDLPYRVEV